MYFPLDDVCCTGWRAPWDSQSFLECVYSASLISTEVLCSSAASVLRSLLTAHYKFTHTHTHLQCPSTQSLHILTHSHRDVQNSDPSVPLLPWGLFLPCQHFWDLPGAKQFAPSPSFTLPIPRPLPSLFFYFRRREKEKENLILHSRGMTVPSPSLSLRFIHA